MMAFCEFQSYRTLKKPDIHFDVSSIVSVLLFIFGLSLLGSRFVFSPGIGINIPEVKNIDLQNTAGILNVGLNGLLMFDSRILKLEALAEEVSIFLSYKKFPQTTILLVCIDRSAPFGIVVEVIDALKSAGCKNIQVACETKNIL